MTKTKQRITFIKGRSGPMRVQTQKQKKKKPTAVGQAMRALGGLGGRALGGYFGAPELGSAAGTQLAALASRWMGFGRYTVSRNSLLRSDASTTIPAMHKNSQTVVVRHKEYIGPIVGSQAFKVQYELPLNPGLFTTFPWLSGVADRYQEYTFKGVVFHYIPSSGTAVASTNAALGTVMLQTTYRASDSKPLAKVEMLNEYCASESVPSETFIHPIECDPKENPFNVQYVRSSAPPANEPLMSYDLGKTFVATQGQQADGFNLGDLWVTYEVELRKPIVHSDVTAAPYFMGVFTAGADWNHLFGTIGSYSGSLVVTAAADLITIPPGETETYLVTIDMSSSNFSVFNDTATPLPVITNGKLVHSLNGSDLVNYSKILSGSAQAIVYFAVQRVDHTQPVLVQMDNIFNLTGTIGSAVHLQVFPLKAILP